jgi:chromosome segregation ATPase
MRVQQMQYQHDHDTKQLRQELQQLQSARAATEDRVQSLVKQSSQLEEQLFEGERQAANTSMQMQEQIRQAQSAQAAAEGQVQTLTLRIKHLESQLQRQSEATAESRAQVETLELRMTEMNRVCTESQQKLASTSLELSALEQHAAAMHAAAERECRSSSLLFCQRLVMIAGCRRRRSARRPAVERVGTCGISSHH